MPRLWRKSRASPVRCGGLFCDVSVHASRALHTGRTDRTHIWWIWLASPSETAVGTVQRRVVPFTEHQGSADLWGINTMDTAHQTAHTGAPKSVIRQPAPVGRLHPLVLPCPFCGGSDIRFTNHGKVSRDPHHRSDDVWSTGCYNCGASFPNRYNKQLLIDCWNRRPSGQDVEVSDAKRSLE